MGWGMYFMSKQGRVSWVYVRNRRNWERRGSKGNIKTNMRDMKECWVSQSI
jgi:hypothetical protein